MGFSAYKSVIQSHLSYAAGSVFGDSDIHRIVNWGDTPTDLFMNVDDYPFVRSYDMVNRGGQVQYTPFGVLRPSGYKSSFDLFREQQGYLAKDQMSPFFAGAHFGGGRFVRASVPADGSARHAVYGDQQLVAGIQQIPFNTTRYTPVNFAGERVFEQASTVVPNPKNTVVRLLTPMCRMPRLQPQQVAPLDPDNFDVARFYSD
jgi:hypothetical protein